MSKSKKILYYILMALAIIAAIILFIDQNWHATILALIAFAWIVNSYLVEDSYYSQKESLDKLTEAYFNSLDRHEKEVKELKDEIEKLSKGE